MDNHRYVSFHRGSRQKLKRRIIAGAAALLVILAAAFVIGKLTENSAEYRQKVTLVEENRNLREQITTLNARILELENTVANQAQYISTVPTAAPEETATEAPAADSPFTAETPRDN